MLDLHTAQIEALYISGDVAWIWGKAEFEGVQQRSRVARQGEMPYAAGV